MTQNSGVRVVANTLQISSSKDKRPHSGDMTFYGVIDEIWQLDYLMVKKIFFKCDWVDDRGVCVNIYVSIMLILMITNKIKND